MAGREISSREISVIRTTTSAWLRTIRRLVGCFRVNEVFSGAGLEQLVEVAPPQSAPALWQYIKRKVSISHPAIDGGPRDTEVFSSLVYGEYVLIHNDTI